MAFSTTSLSHLLATVSAVTLLCAEGQRAAIGANVSTRARSTARDVGAICRTEDVTVTTASNVDMPLLEPTAVAPDAKIVTAKPPCTNCAPSTAKALTAGFPFFVTLVCLTTTLDQFFRTTWYLLRGDKKKVPLFSIDKRRSLRRYTYSIPLRFNVTYSIASNEDLVISGDLCKHTATYGCRRQARGKYGNTEHIFSLANCTIWNVTNRPSDGETAGALGNASICPTAQSLSLAMGFIFQFILMY